MIQFPHNIFEEKKKILKTILVPKNATFIVLFFINLNNPFVK